jgi:hypothetical protein
LQVRVLPEEPILSQVPVELLRVLDFTAPAVPELDVHRLVHLPASQDALLAPVDVVVGPVRELLDRATTNPPGLLNCLGVNDAMKVAMITWRVPKAAA